MEDHFKEEPKVETKVEIKYKFCCFVYTRDLGIKFY